MTEKISQLTEKICQLTEKNLSIERKNLSIDKGNLLIDKKNLSIQKKSVNWQINFFHNSQIKSVNWPIFSVKSILQPNKIFFFITDINNTYYYLKLNTAARAIRMHHSKNHKACRGAPLLRSFAPLQTGRHLTTDRN